MYVLLIVNMFSDRIAKGEEKAQDFNWAVVPLGKTLGDVRSNYKPTRKTGIDFPLEYAALDHPNLLRFLKTPGPRKKGLQFLLLDELNVPGNMWTGCNDGFKYVAQELATYLWYDHYEGLDLEVCVCNINRY